jgi:hypothetical protein
MKKQSVRRNAVICGVFASASLATMIGDVHLDHATPQSAVALAHPKDLEQFVAPPSTPIAATFAMVPLATFAEVNERPLFASDRRPHKTPPRVVAPGTPIVLSGIVILPERRYAMIRDGRSKTVRIAEGDRIALGTIRRIMPDHIEIALANEGDVIVKLFAPGAPKPGNGHAAAPNEGRPDLHTQRPVAQSSPPRPPGDAIDAAAPPNDAPPRSG